MSATYDFTTHGGTSQQVSLPVNAAAFDSYRAEFSATRHFETITLTKNSLAVSGNNIMLALSSSDIDTIKDAQFRVIGTKSSVDYLIWEGSIDYKPALPTTVTAGPPPLPPIIRRYVHVLTAAPGRFGFDVTFTWGNGFIDPEYNVDVTLLDPTADTQACWVENFVERGDGTGGTVTIMPGHPDLAAGQHIEIWGYSPKLNLFG